jgi:hypothetical protein
MGEYNVIDSIWFGAIGIVRVRPEYGEDKFYIGASDGTNQRQDEQKIARSGMPYYSSAVERFFDVH